MPRLVDEASRLQEKLSKLKEERYGLTVENMAVIFIGTENSESKTTTG